MLKLLVLSAVVAVVYGAPKPGYLHGEIPDVTNDAARIAVNTPARRVYTSIVPEREPIFYGFRYGLGPGYSSLEHGYGLRRSERSKVRSYIPVEEDIAMFL